ncbi:MAG: N-acetylmuramate 1-kinase [Acidobacteriota bacterium]|jgi:aminoglycoside/choline kinase family phosphotransferase|nr:N-acetylmuramate 1-kinase [Acidobacteriota bacterium]
MAQPIQPTQSIEEPIQTEGLAAAGFPPIAVRPLAGDVSPRRYSRVALAGGASAILATYPPEIRATCPRFHRTTEILTGAGVRVPRILASDCEEGWMLLEDVGFQTLGEWGCDRPWNELAPWFATAVEIAGKIARLPMTADLAELNPPLGSELLRRELAQTWDLFLEPRGLVAGLAGAGGADLRAALDALCAALCAEPPVPCHRDFMVRNLMPLPGGEATGELAVLDHQDLRLGPPLYDAASLLNDTLFPPAEAEEALVASIATTPADRIRYHRAAAQRTLKAVGTYASFARRGAPRHLPLIPPTLARFVKHFSRLPEGETLAARLAVDWRHELEPPVD